MEGLALIALVVIVAKLFDNGQAKRLKEVARGKRRARDIHKRD